MNTERIKEIQQQTAYPESVSVQQALLKVWNECEQEQLRIGAVNGCFYLQSEKTPADSGEYEVITNRGRVIKIKYKVFEDNGIWECEYGKHEINESVVAWRFLK